MWDLWVGDDEAEQGGVQRQLVGQRRQLHEPVHACHQALQHAAARLLPRPRACFCVAPSLPALHKLIVLAQARPLPTSADHADSLRELPQRPSLLQASEHHRPCVCHMYQ